MPQETTTSVPEERPTQPSPASPPTNGATATTATASGDDAPEQPRRLTPRLLLRPIGIYAASRIAVLTAMWLATRMVPGAPTGFTFLSWDGNLYYQIITGGYSEFPADRGIFAFFPLYPLTARTLAAVPGIGALEAGLIVGAVAGFLAAIALWALCHHLLGQDTADRAIALFAFFPGSFVLSMLYSEGVMIALSAACLWALVRHKWLVAGVLAALATASRPNALALVAACAWAAGAAIVSRREWRSLVAPALAPLGILGFFGLLWSVTGDPLTWFTVQRELWKERVTPLALPHDVRDFVNAPFENTNTTAVIVGTVISLVGLVLLVRSRLPFVLTVYSAGVIALAACSETLGARPRFVLTAFPIFFVFALKLRGVAFAAALGILATVLGGFTLISLDTILFTP